MTAIVREWIEKADGDLATASRECRARKNPNFDAVCFHAQQCIEKYLKAVLQKYGVPFQKTHDLSVLLSACTTYCPLWESFRNELKMLTQYATVFRYPGESATQEQAKHALNVAKKIRDEIRISLNLENK